MKKRPQRQVFELRLDDAVVAVGFGTQGTNAEDTHHEALRAKLIKGHWATV